MNLSGNIVLFEIGTLVGIVFNIIIYMFHKGVTKYFCIAICLVVTFIVSSIIHWKIIPLELIALFFLFSNINLFNINKMLHWDIFIKTFMILSFIILNILNILPNTNSIGYSLGFLNPNDAGSLILSTIFSIILLVNNKNYYSKHYSVLITSLFLIIIFYILTQCRALIISGIFVLVFVYLKKWTILHKIIFKFSVIIGAILSFMSIILSYWFNPLNQIWNLVNDISSNRLAMQSLFIQAKPLKLYGQSISRFALQTIYNIFQLPSLSNLGSVSNFTIDNFYLSTAYFYGIIGAIVVIITFLMGMHISVRCKQYIPSVIMLSLLIYSCIESDTLSIYNMMPLLYIIYCNFNIDKCTNDKINKSFNRR